MFGILFFWGVFYGFEVGYELVVVVYVYYDVNYGGFWCEFCFFELFVYVFDWYGCDFY